MPHSVTARHRALAILAGAVAVFGGGVLVGRYAFSGSHKAASSAPTALHQVPAPVNTIPAVGATATLTGAGGSEVAVTLEHVRARPDAEAGSGHRVFEVDLRLTDVGPAPVTLLPATEMVLLDAAGHTLGVGKTPQTFPGCQPWGTADVTLRPGASRGGCLFFSLDGAVVATTAEYRPARAPFAGRGIARWALPPG